MRKFTTDLIIKVISLCGLILFLSTQLSFAQTQDYSVSVVSVPEVTIPGGETYTGNLYPRGLNDNGQFAGYGMVWNSEIGWTISNSYFWDGNNLVDLGSQYSSLRETNGLSPISSPSDPYPAALFKEWGSAVNNAGVVVGCGWYLTEGGGKARTGVIWQGGAASFLEPSTVNDQAIYATYAADINNRNQIVGYHGSSGSANKEGFMWSQETAISLGAGFAPNAVNDNENAQVVGRIGGAASDPYHAALWNNGVLSYLPTDPGTNSDASDINNSGQIVGYSTFESSPGIYGGIIPVMWSNGQMINLELLPGTNTGEAYAINDLGQIVGISGSSAVLWQDGKILDLQTLIPSDSGLVLRSGSYAEFDINENGQILVSARDVNGKDVCVILTPVPELSTFWQLILAAGLVGLVYLRSYSKRVASHRK